MNVSSPPQESTGALAGVTVLELGARIGVSVAGSLLAQLGATVVFAEAASAGGFAQPKWQLRDQYAAGKQSLAVDASRQDDLQLVARLAAASDAVLLSTDVDILAYGASPLAQPCPAIVCDLTAFGSSGPLRGVPATDVQIQALAGVLDTTGLSDGPPMAIPLPLIEQLAGVYAASGVLAALRQRRQDPGCTCAVEIALYDVAFSAMTSFLAPALSGGDGGEPSRVGNRHTMAAPWNVYGAQDGWVLLCAGNDEQWERICELTGERPGHLARNAARIAGADEVDALVQAWVGRRSIAECVQRLSALGIPCGPVAPIDGFPREANLAHRQMVFEAAGADGRGLKLPGSPLRMSQSAGRALLHVPAPDADRGRLVAAAGQRVARAVRQPTGQPRGLPLAGLRVVEIGHYTTAPVATRLLAALGADVIKVEPPEGEAVRRWPPARNGQGIFFTFQNADKRSLALDMNSADGAATLKRLIAGADVLVEKLRPGALELKVFGPSDMLALQPRLVYCSISGFGADSLYPGRPAFDTVIQAMSGMMAINRIGDMPLKTGPSLADVLGAAVGVLSVMAALEYRERSGTGQVIDLSMQDVCAWATQAGWNGAAAGAAGTVLACSDGYVLAGRGSAGVETLTRAQAVATLAQAGVPAVPVLATPEVVLEPQTEARGLWVMVAAQGAQYPVLASPIRFAGKAGAVPRPGPALGRDNAQILQELT